MRQGHAKELGSHSEGAEEPSMGECCVQICTCYTAHFSSNRQDRPDNHEQTSQETTATIQVSNNDALGEGHGSGDGNSIVHRFEKYYGGKMNTIS